MSGLFGIPFPASTVVLSVLDTWRLVLSPYISPSRFASTMAHCYCIHAIHMFLRCTILAFIHIFIINHNQGWPRIRPGGGLPAHDFPCFPSLIYSMVTTNPIIHILECFSESKCSMSTAALIS